MSTVGIIAEFNPFHNGHMYAINKARELTGADTVIVVMSGDFVQRGAPAVCDKYLRTEMALSCGADAVFELPVRYSSSSAQGFAEGACTLLAETGVVDYLCFGSECGNIETISHIADEIERFEKDPAFHAKLVELMSTGRSFPAARAELIAINTGIDPTIINSPNNILAIEYCLALKKLSAIGKCPVPVTFKRLGDNYNEDSITDSFFTSATAIRRLLTATKRGDELSFIEPYIPDKCLKILRHGLSSGLPLTEDDFSTALYVKINSMSEEELRLIPGINGDLLNSIINRTKTPFRIIRLIADIKSKAFTYTAISRALFSILLAPVPPAPDSDGTRVTSPSGSEVTASDDTVASSEAATSVHTGSASDVSAASHESADSSNDFSNNRAFSPYLRLLGFRRASSGILRDIRKNAAVPVITKLADADLTQTMLLQDINAAKLYEQVKISKFGTGSYKDEFRTGVIIKD